jgi:uncharacterized protein (DUF58 family)
VRLTSRGYGLLVAGVVLLAAGFWFGYPELATLGASGIVAVLGALIFVAWRPQLTVERVADPDRLMRGETSRVTLNIANASRLFGASRVARDRIQPGGSVPVPLVRLRPGRVTSVSYLVPTARRGVIEVGPLDISRRDPLGLVGVVRSYGGATKVWVRPRVHPIAAVPVGLSRSMDGRVDKVPHGSITFAALREYVIGDDLRHVHWRTSARVGELMVREHVDTSLPRVVLLLDDRERAHTTLLPTVDGRGPGESTFEAVCEAAASVLVAAFREDIHVRIQFVSGMAGAEGHVEIGPLLDLLAEANLTRDGSLRTAVEVLRVRRVGDTLLYLTGPPNEEDLGALAGLRGAYPSIIAAVFGPVESGLAPTAGVLVVGAADGADFAAAWDGVRAW